MIITIRDTVINRAQERVVNNTSTFSHAASSIRRDWKCALEFSRCKISLESILDCSMVTSRAAAISIMLTLALAPVLLGIPGCCYFSLAAREKYTLAIKRDPNADNIIYARARVGPRAS